MDPPLPAVPYPVHLTLQSVLQSGVPIGLGGRDGIDTTPPPPTREGAGINRLRIDAPPAVVAAVDAVRNDDEEDDAGSRNLSSTINSYSTLSYLEPNASSSSKYR